MDSKFILSCESTVDLPFAYIDGRDIPVLFYHYTVDGMDYEDDMCRKPGAKEEFYGLLDAGKFPATYQLNEFTYYEFFSQFSGKGKLLHIAFGTGMTSSYNNAVAAVERLKSENFDCEIEVIDSLCSSSGYGMLVDYAADMRDEGCTLEETAEWVFAHRQRIHHQFFSTDLKYFRKSGRVSGTAATIGAILNICPIMRLDDRGRIIAYDKVRGRHNAIKRMVDTMIGHAEGAGSYSGKCFICNSNDQADAEKLKEAIEARVPALKDKIRICDIGSIIAAHCGPNTVAVFFMGDERAPE